MQSYAILKHNGSITKIIVTSCHLLTFLFAWCLRPINSVLWQKICFESFQFVEVKK